MQTAPIKSRRLPLAVLLAILTFFSMSQAAFAAQLTNAYIRYDRIKASTATPVLVVVKPTTVASEGKIKVTFASGTTVAPTGAGLTVGTSNLPTGVTAVPGTLTIASSSQDVTISGVTDMSVGTLYGVYITAGITTASAGEYQDIVYTQTGASAAIDQANVASRFISDDQIVISATVPSSFNFVLGANSTAFTTNLDSASIVSTTGVTATITTNAAHGWIAWVKSNNAALSSATAGVSIATAGTVDAAPSTLSNGVNGYVLDVDLTTDNGSGTGAVTIDPEYNGTTTSQGGTLSTSFQPIASCTGTTAGDVLTLIGRAAITTYQAAATDYTDTLTVVGAGNF